MARRKNRDADWAELVAGLTVLLLVITWISPQARRTIYALGILGLCVFGLALIALIAFAIYRFKTRSQRPRPTDTFSLSSAAQSSARPPGVPRVALPDQPDPPAPQTTAQLLESVRSLDWFQFEKLVAFAYRKLGYTVSRRGGANPDGGIDLLLEKDGQRSAVQCKQWKSWNVGVKPVREFLGALTDAGIQHGILITLCGYTDEAKQLADKHGIEMVNETGLAHMLQSTAAASDPEVLALLRDTRKFCPKCENEMVLRTATKGLGAGKQFWGCSAYPRCRFTMPAPETTA
ncbi:MAG TPA: restriction endonuclease [Verrucomicrobiota bacterium]|jgi:hypothetical protein|nr:hypothetical protein [Limisphaerales bacterium]HNR72440.1 restriction endonuclease [Verrucomicrobiota bacterium]HRR63725.1 restriction endonuclease [Candidatus Paceibacterota bacterium]HNS70052.1 restriction endonuclease [Verrucomicrobiota bacterium]HOS75852.1 restriction endonuclease [Verrucomicrobiota bacterium]